MEKEIVPYELALRLKNLGFSELVNYFYSNGGILHPRVLSSGYEPMDFEPSDFCENFNTNVKYQVGNSYYFENVISAPTISQVFRWFRDKQDMCGYVRRGSKTMHEHLKKEGFAVRDYEWSIITTEGVYLNCRGMENTYEEAELACIEKLIEIVESQKEQND
jgi:hypothetical protein